MGFSFVQLFADQTDIWSAGYLVMTLCKDTLNQGVDDDLSMAPKAQRAIEQIHSFTDTVLVHQMALPPVFCLIRKMHRPQALDATLKTRFALGIYSTFTTRGHAPRARLTLIAPIGGSTPADVPTSKYDINADALKIRKVRTYNSV
ncbi:hypothetical protein CERZMDRAFT_92381 [Cercospora zeae-maydis SCOH1-5]|uniref:Uncharacterized protein n=1 Tax=Cercospora zeae-maydis SCOH1-5 TaxID=717836 RepID=A0A6A6FWG4_9PEZI|nr:hypothetical protein CERZMDRAFT_92381 [Cercospora zeae-maydis SCOH1-5]